MTDYTTEEAALVNQMQQFQPHPRPKAYQRMAQAPWLITATKPSVRLNLLHPKWLVAAVLIAAMAGALVWLTPPLRALAQAVIDGLFNRASSSSITISPLENTTGTESVWLSLPEAEARAGFSLRLPDALPTGYSFAGAGYTESRHAASLIYERPGAELVITQQPAAFAEFGLLTDGGIGIGLNARVERVQIGQSEGEYVVGTWTRTGDDQAVWRADAPYQRLRWQKGIMIYEILAMGGSLDTGSGLDRNSLIALALSLQ
jgi:hypothetical protein